MSFSTDMADLIAKQLSRLITLNRHQLAGQVANLDFWLGEVQHALAVIDGYGVRFTRMHAAQEQYVTAHGTTEFDLAADWDTQRRASPPRRVSGHELEKARRNLTQAASRFLERCRSDGSLPEEQFSAAMGTLGVRRQQSWIAG
jgi:hypothetical protein